VLEMFNDFYRGELNLIRLNYNTISLILKIEEANNIKKYRPINLLNVDYKWFTKSANLETYSTGSGMLGNSGKPVTLETLSLTTFLRHVFQEQETHDFRKPGTCEASDSRMREVRES
jgi:hypothetical protein